MKAKVILILLSLSIFSVFTSDESNHIITIDKANLYEYLKLQQIKLSIVPNFDIDPKKLYSLDLTCGLKSYKTPLNCIKAERQRLSVLVTCDINLSQVPLGTYLISKFNYTNITYISSALIKIKEMDSKKISEIKLEKIYGSLKEYGLSSRPIHFHFSIGVEYKKLVSIKIEDKDKNEYKMEIGGCNPEMDYYELNYHVYCYANIKYKAGIYKVIYVQYEKELILPSSEEVSLKIEEDNLDLEIAYQYHGREICAGKLNDILFQFKDFSVGVFLSKIFFKNSKTNKVYEPRFDFIYNPEKGGQGIEMIFDFFGMPPGKYYIDYIYENRMIKSQFIIELKLCKPIDYSQFYQN